MCSHWDTNADHAVPGQKEIFEETKHLPGWQEPGDSSKLYEMGYFAGDVILEIGVYGGRSAVVALRGALSNPKRSQRPQFYGLDLDPTSISRSLATLEAEGLAEYALLFQGDIQAFMAHFNIQPTMVFVDGDHTYEGVHRDLLALGELLPAGIPVLCHDYTNPENDSGAFGVTQATNEWKEAGYAAFCGTYGCSALFVTTDRCRGPRVRLPDELFARERHRLLAAYGLTSALEDDASAWRERALAAEAGLERILGSRTYRFIVLLSATVVQPLKRLIQTIGQLVR